MIEKVEAEIAGRILAIETGRFAEQAGGAVTVCYGETVVLACATASKEPREGIDFLPLTVDYEEKLYAAGKIPGGYIKREGRPSTEAVLNGRLADRPIRPLFPKGFRNDVQVVLTVLSADQENDPDILGVIGASAALSISDIPFDGPVGAVRVGLIDQELVMNPTHAQRARSRLDLVVAGTRDAIMMVEGNADGITEEEALKALRFAHEHIVEAIRLQEQLVEKAGKPKLPFEPPKPAEELDQALDAIVGERLEGALFHQDKTQREAEVSALRAAVIEQLAPQFDVKQILNLFESHMKDVVRRAILDHGKRPDGRALKEIRPISCEVGLLPRTHGSGLFKRGQTQVLSIVTLGTESDEQIIDGLVPEEKKRFMHHYNFPPFSTGEVKRMGSPGRREIGHGMLAERSLEAVLPSEEDFPYTIRIVSEVLSSNGSTSMGSVCGSTLALMDAGVPIKAPVAGAAMGLVMGGGGKFTVLTDIQGIEDALGDMDFKVAGTELGITGLQMDIKVRGITFEIMEQAMEQAREARLFILNKMLDVIEEPRAEPSRYAPRLYTIHINPDKIRNVIGPGGKMIRSIIDEFKVTIDVSDDGRVVIGSSDAAAADKAIRKIQGLTMDVEVGQIYTGKVTRTTSFGAFVEILPNKEGLVRIGELDVYRVPSVDDVVKVGDEIMVMVTEIDRMGRINLSRRAVLAGETNGTGAAVHDGPSYAGERHARTPGRPQGVSGEGERRPGLTPRRIEPPHGEGRGPGGPGGGGPRRRR